MRTFLTILLSSVALTLASSAPVRADEKQTANADTAFLTNTLADIQLVRLDVGAVSDEELDDDPEELVALS